MNEGCQQFKINREHKLPQIYCLESIFFSMVQLTFVIMYLLLSVYKWYEEAQLVIYLKSMNILVEI